MKLINKLAAEFIGTTVLVLFGCGAAAIGGSTLGILGIAAAFGLSLTAMYYVIGNVSGCHINPAVSLAFFLDSKLPWVELLLYVAAQIAGAFLGAAALALILESTQEMGVAVNGLAANMYGEGSVVGIDAVGAFVTETVLTFVFVITVLGVNSNAKFENFAGIVSGSALTLVSIFGLSITGASVNPARSIAAAVFTRGNALSQLWLFIIAPLCGAVLATIVWKSLRATRR